ncbi:MAG TPA: M20/M25/M40 family metallo-hydrolase [Thermoanaerobaculia bacterium]|nr:M20/M25/M40 family metallo-hydrolase [Thermoanaerobaculia bacterium]
MTLPRRLLGCLALLLIVLSGGSCRKSEAVAEDPADLEAEQYFISYLRIDTSNPPGNETAAANFFHQIFQKEGIESRLVGPNPARMSVYARLRSGSSAPALVLMHHLDVVPADDVHWTVPPFEGVSKGGYIWGRGALDIKSMGVANLMAMLDLKRSGATLNRDVIFLGVADEEVGGAMGAQFLLEKHPELFEGIGYVLNEGGSNETIVDYVSYWGIEIAQKVPLWVRISTKGRAEHAAVPPDSGGSAAQLLDILRDLQAMPRPYHLTPAVRDYFLSLAKAKKGEKQEMLLNPERYENNPQLASRLPAGSRSLLTHTMAITRLQAGSVINAMPTEASAWLDFRLLPGSSPQAMVRELDRVIGERGELEVVLAGITTPPAPSNTDLYQALERVMRRAEPRSVVGPLVSAGTSDSRFFRARGVPTYGISPFKVNYYDGDTVHGPDERIRRTFFLQGVGVMKQIVREFCVERG